MPRNPEGMPPEGAASEDMPQQAEPRDPLATMAFSQTALRTYADCPLRFRRRYLDGLYWERSGEPEEEAEREQGTWFHLEAERLYRGIPLGPDGRSPDPERQRWLENLARFRPATGERLFPELRLTSEVVGGSLEATFDLVAVSPGGETLTIYDWKTQRRGPPASRWLAADWQTVVYLLVLAREVQQLPGVAVPPPAEALSMVYFNPRYPEEPVTIHYTAARHQEGERRVAAALGAIRTATQGYLRGEPDAFPPCGKPERCRRCEFSPLCLAEGFLPPASHSGI